MYAKVKKSHFAGQVFISPSKSETMRAIILAALGNEVSYVENILISPDTYAMIKGIEAFGAKVVQINTNLIITGVGKHLKLPKDVIDVGNSGLAFRFLLALSCLVEGEVRITGDNSIKYKRIVAPLLEVYRESGMEIQSFSETNFEYISVKGKLNPGIMTIEGSDSQVVSSLLISTQFLPANSKIVVFDPGETPYIDLTTFFLGLVGSEIKNNNYREYKVTGGLTYSGFRFIIGGDYSSTLFPIAAALVTKGRVSISGLEKNSFQPDLKALNILQRMGASIGFNEFEQLEVCQGGPLQGVRVDINDCIDILPILVVVASFALSPTFITGYEIAKSKESDRVSSMKTQLSKMGGKMEEKNGQLIVFPRPLIGAEIESCKDHRIGLAFLVAALATKGTTRINALECSVKSYPTAIFDFLSCGAKIDLCRKNL